MTHPFRFGVQLHKLPVDAIADTVRRIERLGYSTIFFPDHFSDQWDPTASLAAIAALSERLHVGTLVYDVDYRHPVIHAKAAATLQLLSGGRHEFGIGAGWMRSDYDEAGITYDPPAVRIDRLGEALEICRSMWTRQKTSFRGEHYRVSEIAGATDPLPDPPPRVLIGGGGPRILRLAGRFADIVGINPKLEEGKVTADTPKDSRPERVRRKIEWVREGAEAAGRDPDAIEFNTLSFVVAFADDPTGLRQGIAANTGMSPEEVADCPLFVTGSPNEVRDRLQKRRDQTGISYLTIQGDRTDVLEQFAEHVVEPLAGK